MDYLRRTNLKSPVRFDAPENATVLDELFGWVEALNRTSSDAPKDATGPLTIRASSRSTVRIVDPNP